MRFEICMPGKVWWCVCVWGDCWAFNGLSFGRHVNMLDLLISKKKWLYGVESVNGKRGKA